MELRLLGPTEARVRGQPIALGAPKQRALLAMLGLDVGRTVSADRLAQGLWGEEPPPSAPKMVQLYVSHLRRLLDGNGATIVTRGRGYELRLTDGEVDAVRFERLLEDSRPREALALWGGEPLADLAGEPFAAAEIRRLCDLRLRAVERVVEEDLAAGRHAEVIGELEALIAEHPLRERLHAQRMLALYRSGRQAEALEAYREARTLLVEEVGVEPGAELRRLQAGILAQDPVLDAPAEARPPGTPARPPPSRYFVRMVAAGLVVVAALIAFGVIRLSQPDRLAGIAENSVGLIDPDGGAITAQYRVGRGPGAVAAGGGSIWVANALDGTVSRIGRGTDAPVTIPVGGAPGGLAYGERSLWVADGDSRSVVQVDPGANKVLQRIEVANAPRAIAAAGGALWVASGVDGVVRRIDIERPGRSRPTPIGANPTAIAAGAGAIWVASEEAGTVTRIEPASGAVVRAIPVGNGPVAVAVGEGAVWVANRHDGTVSRIDPATNSVSWAVPAGEDPSAVAAGAGAVWVAGGESGSVFRIDPEAPRVLQTIEAGSSPSAVAIDERGVWTTAVAPQAAHRGGTLRVLLPGAGTPGDVPVDWLDSAAYNWRTLHVTSLVYDGLVGYRRVSGAAGATLVGALAASAPQPSGDGRTYVFTLRPGRRYSDGRPVRPEDFRASMERYLRLTRNEFPQYFAGISGAGRCVARPARCDLSEGIRTDARARTITIRLTRPDDEFLHKLTTQFAYVVPSDTPDRYAADRPPPGTGPYRIAAWDGARGGRLVRNPHFRSGSPQSRPAGSAERVEFTLRPDAEIEAQIADVRRGTADVVFLADPFGSAVSADRLTALTAGAPGQLHSVPVATTDWMFLNVRRRPFDDVRVRRALNHATDRSRIVAIGGGSEVAGPTCQILPPGFPGHEPYCRYTAAPVAGGGWTAPDLERARSLVARSGRAGERVVVRAPEFRRAVGRYFVALLDDLGFRATLRVLADDAYFPAIQDPASRAQMGFVGWSLDFVSPSSFIGPSFGCSERGPIEENASRLCDPVLTRLIARARAARGADAATAWAAADRRLVDLAPAVPMTNRRGVALVSRRVGNFQSHPMWLTLLDQLWVR